MVNFVLLNVFVLWITVLDPCTKLLLALSFVCRLDFTSGHESTLMFFLSWKQIGPCSKETVLRMRSVHESSKWLTEVQTWATLFRHVEDSAIAHHRRYRRRMYCVRLVHLMAFCPSLVFWRCRHGICFCELVFYLFSCSKRTVHKKRTKWKHGKQMNKETKLRIHNITAKVAMKFGSEAWVLNKREEQRLEAA